MKNWCYVIAAGCAVGVSAPAYAQKTAKAPAAAPAAAPAPAEAAWKLICPQAPAPAAGAAPAPAGSTPCGLVQNLVAGEKKQRLLTVIFKRSAPTGHNVTLALPHGLLFAPGVGLQIDETPERSLPVQTSDENGAYTGGDVDAALLTALQAGKTLKISFTGGTGQRIMVPVTLKDFAPGLAALDRTPLPPAPAPAPAAAAAPRKPN